LIIVSRLLLGFFFHGR